jgi:hypothetical protein
MVRSAARRVAPRDSITMAVNWIEVGSIATAISALATSAAAAFTANMARRTRQAVQQTKHLIDAANTQAHASTTQADAARSPSPGPGRDHRRAGDRGHGLVGWLGPRNSPNLARVPPRPRRWPATARTAAACCRGRIRLSWGWSAVRAGPSSLPPPRGGLRRATRPGARAWRMVRVSALWPIAPTLELQNFAKVQLMPVRPRRCGPLARAESM